MEKKSQIERFRWLYVKEWKLIRDDGYEAATVWDNGTWHTWNNCGIGGENSCEPLVSSAMNEAELAVLRQGWADTKTELEECEEQIEELEDKLEAAHNHLKEAGKNAAELAFALDKGDEEEAWKAVKRNTELFAKLAAELFDGK